MSEQSFEAAPVNAVTTTASGATARAERRVATLDLSKRIRENLGLWLIYLFLAVMVVFSIFPIYFVFQASFSPNQALVSTNLTLLPSQPSLSNYQFVIGQLPFLRWMANSIIACGLATIIGLVCATTGAYALSRFRFWGHRYALVILISLQTFPGLLAIYAYYNVLTSIHLDQTLEGLAIVYAAGNVVFGVLNIKGYFDTIPVELEEAARVDGASYFRTFFSIILPLSTPALAASALFMFIGGWNEFALAKLILSPDSNQLTVPVGIFQLLQSNFTPWGYFAATAVLVSIPLMILFLFAQRFFQSGLTIGSVKG